MGLSTGHSRRRTILNSAGGLAGFLGACFKARAALWFFRTRLVVVFMTAFHSGFALIRVSARIRAFLFSTLLGGSDRSTKPASEAHIQPPAREHSWNPKAIARFALGPP